MRVWDCPRGPDCSTACVIPMVPQSGGVSFLPPQDLETRPGSSLLGRLLPKCRGRSQNLLVAGRCIGCDQLSQASLRGVATCMATGHAAGTAAALAAIQRVSTRNIDVRGLQDKLVEQDAILAAGV